ncbi:hypothetical protein SLA2020_246950 [Shorea laevis]
MLWKEIIKELYGGVGNREWEGCVQDRRGSSWWRELWKLEEEGGAGDGWLGGGFVKQIGNGKKTHFWEDVWVGEVRLREKYPRLYSLATNKRVKVAELGEWSEGVWSWKWDWRRDLFVWETDLVQELKNDLNMVIFNHDGEDKWTWRWESNGKYTVKSAYQHLGQPHQVGGSEIFKVIWNKLVPLKVSALAWRAIQDRIPTKVNLRKRGVITEEAELKCRLCSKKEESTDHVLVECIYAWRIWVACYSWWGVCTASQSSIQNHFRQHTDLFRQLKVKEAWNLIWYAVIWTLWNWRNQMVFGKEMNKEMEVVDLIKLKSFAWLKAKDYPELDLEMWKLNPRQAISML